MIAVFVFALMSIAAAVMTVALKIQSTAAGFAGPPARLDFSPLNAEFLWAVQVIVYAGAILVLYLSS